MERMLGEVSETALITLRSRAVESQKENPVINDPVGIQVYEQLLDSIPAEMKQRILQRRLSPVLSGYIGHRARKYDDLCREFLSRYPDGMVMNLGCGFDTRFWRLGIGADKYMELDLPEVMALKKRILGDKLTYPVVEGSVLDEDWISRLKSLQSQRIIFLAEGLFMYLPEDQSIRVLTEIAGTFTESMMVMEVVHSKYTRGFRKKLVEKKMRKGAGSTAGDYYHYGIQSSSEFEGYHHRFSIQGEWSCFEDSDLKPAILRLLRYFKAFTRNQYTVIADII